MFFASKHFCVSFISAHLSTQLRFLSNFVATYQFFNSFNESANLLLTATVPHHLIIQQSNTIKPDYRALTMSNEWSVRNMQKSKHVVVIFAILVWSQCIFGGYPLSPHPLPLHPKKIHSKADFSFFMMTFHSYPNGSYSPSKQADHKYQFTSDRLPSDR